MEEMELRGKVERMVEELRLKIESSVPEEGSFAMVYSEFEVRDRDLCLTDVLLQFRAIPEFLEDSATKRWVELVGYKLPVPIKATRIMFMGTREEASGYLKGPEAVDKIVRAIPELDYNMRDV